MAEPFVPDQRAILAARGARNVLDPARPYAFFVESEPTACGTIEEVAVILISNRECGFKCLMCDLWRNTTVERLAVGLVAEQVERALGELPLTPHVKLYNAGNFFDEQAISRQDVSRIAGLVADRRTVIVECHPKLVDRRCLAFAAQLDGRFEVAMGLETVDPEVLPRLNKRMTLDDYERAARFLVDRGIAVRAFILLRAPYQTESQGVDWAKRSLDYAFSLGLGCCTVIPTRGGNGIMDELRRKGLFDPPRLGSLEAVLDYGLSLGRGRVFADLWDVELSRECPRCAPERVARLRRMNLTQRCLPPVLCPCEGAAACW